MVTVNISKPEDYYSQRNNRLFPLSTCNTTSMIMALTLLGVKYPTKPGVQPEDLLTEITEQKKYYDKMLDLGVKDKSIKPRNIHVLLAEATNEFVGKEVVRFGSYSFDGILNDLCNDIPAVVTGSFTASGHIVCLVGATFRETLNKVSTAYSKTSLVESVIVDDPYGNFFTKYSDSKGDDVVFPVDTLKSLLRKGDKGDTYLAHRFRKEGWS